MLNNNHNMILYRTTKNHILKQIPPKNISLRNH